MYIYSILLILFLVLIFRKGLFKKDVFSSKSNPFSNNSRKGMMTIEDKYNENKVVKQKELNTLLDKINNKGLDSLSQKEKIRLDELSKN